MSLRKAAVAEHQIAVGCATDQERRDLNRPHAVLRPPAEYFQLDVRQIPWAATARVGKMRPVVAIENGGHQIGLSCRVFECHWPAKSASAGTTGRLHGSIGFAQVWPVPTSLVSFRHVGETRSTAIRSAPIESAAEDSAWWDWRNLND